MRVLLCSPYLQNPGLILGGINMWAHNLLQYRETIDSDVEIVPASFDRRNYVSVDSNVLKRISLGIKVYSVAIREAKKKMDNNNIDVVHICTSASISLTKDLLVLRAARKRNIRTVLHLHFGRTPELYKKKNWEWFLLKKAAGIADAVLTMDKQSYQVLKELNFNVFYCPNPLSIDISNQIDQEKDSIKRIPGKVVFVGHVLPSKGVFELVEASAQQDNIKLDVIGKVEEPIKSELIQIASQRNSGAWLTFRGEISHKEVIRELLSASLFAFPSYTEGFPNVILEAMACGTPIVTTKVGAIPEMLDIESGINYGLCVEPKDVLAFSDAMKSFLKNPEYAYDCAAKAQQRVNDLYACPIVWNKLVDVWKYSLV